MPPVARLLAAIATATDPAATQNAIRQSGQQGLLTDKLNGIVILGDASSLIAFALAVIFASRPKIEMQLHILADASREISGALRVGAAVDLPAAYLTGRLQKGHHCRPRL